RMTIEAEAPPFDEASQSYSRSMGAIYPWIVVIVLTLLYTSSFIDRTILGTLVKPIRADLDITDTEFSYLTGLAFVVIYTIVGIPMGRIADHRSRRVLATVGV